MEIVLFCLLLKFNSDRKLNSSKLIIKRLDFVLYISEKKYINLLCI